MVRIRLDNVDWNIYYDEFWQFALTLVSQLLTTVIILYLVTKTCYLFWCRDCKPSHELPRTLSRESIERLRSSFKLMTVSYLICFGAYTVSSLFFRVYVIMFHGSIWCWIPDMMSSWLFIARTILQLIYLMRFV